mmetsp:Transcript_49507/g.72629  ORF Transcript_49507/g.72629 Transcript_49507/m.72629 type:complete len:127 (+) Transcript_49507:87-467(+)
MDHVEFDDTHTHTYIHTRMRVRTQNHTHSHMHEYTHTQYHDLAVHAHYHSFDRLVYICPNASDPKSRFEMPNSSDSERLFARPMGTFMNAGSAVSQYMCACVCVCVRVKTCASSRSWNPDAGIQRF